MKKAFLNIRKGNYDIIRQFIRYTFVGGVAALADLSLFYLLSGIIGVNYIISNSISFISGLLVNYFMSREWVFNQFDHRFGRDFLLFAVIGIIGLGISNLILYVLIDLGVLLTVMPFVLMKHKKICAKLVAVFIVLFWNFAARRRIVFNTA